jgi:hypothetical protein
MSDYCADAKRECDLLTRLTAERERADRAEADAVVLRDRLRQSRDFAASASCTEEQGLAQHRSDADYERRDLDKLLSQPHPGDPLRERLESLPKLVTALRNELAAERESVQKAWQQVVDVEAEAKRYREALEAIIGLFVVKKTCKVFRHDPFDIYYMARQALNAGEE